MMSNCSKWEGIKEMQRHLEHQFNHINLNNTIKERLWIISGTRADNRLMGSCMILHWLMYNHIQMWMNLTTRNFKVMNTFRLITFTMIASLSQINYQDQV